MYTQTLKTPFLQAQIRPIPQTSQGRALFTTAWFLTGIRPAETYDDPGFHILGDRHVNA